MRANGGAGGPDGVTIDQIVALEDGPGRLVEDLHEALRSRTYRPGAIRRVWIPKPDGRQRPLGIPNVVDRVAQMAALRVLEPIFEADFADCSYGFRPGRLAHDAIAAVSDHLKAGYRTVIETRLGLTLNRDKTRIVDLRQSGSALDFLGYTFRYDRDLHGGSHRYLYVGPSAKALARARDHLRELTAARYCFVPLPHLIARINRYLVGWQAYFRVGYPRRSYRHLNHHARRRLACHLRRRSQRPFRLPEGVTLYRHLADLGLVYL